jgi:hypothetical protein
VRTYDVAALAPLDATDADWALANTRRFLRDTPNEANAYHPRSFLDLELTAQLALDTVSHEGVTYYRPHVTASTLLKADPERVLSFTGAGYSETYPSAEAAARAILQAGSGIDDWINDEVGFELASTGRVARVVF